MTRSFESRVELFAEQLFAPESEVYDPVKVHHEFTQGLHGRKIDFDNVHEGTELYEEWVDLTAEAVMVDIPKSFLRHAVLVGVASRTNPFVVDVVEAVGHGIRAIQTVKNEKGLPILDEETIDQLHSINPLICEVEEDVITRGTNSSSVAASVHVNRPNRLISIEVFGTVQRGIPELLVAPGIPYFSLIKKLMRDYTPAECLKRGYCADEWELIPKKKKAA